MIVSKTPLRISFVGGGSDLSAYYKHNFGAVVSTAIDKFVYVMVNHRFDGKIRVSYSRAESVKHVDEVEHDIIREALKLTGITHGIEITYFGDIPIGQEGTGMGSSSSLAVGILCALYAYKKQPVSAEQLGREASQIEIDILKRPIGKQDQYAAAYGGFNYIRFNKSGSVLVEPVVFKNGAKQALDKRLLLFHTGMKTQSSAVLSEQKKKTKDNLSILKEMVGLTSDIKAVLSSGTLNEFGGLLHQNWFLKQKLASKITNNVIDTYYEKARMAGAKGGKVLGSGGGGFLLFYCEEKDQSKVRRALADLEEVPFRFEEEGSKIVYLD